MSMFLPLLIIIIIFFSMMAAIISLYDFDSYLFFGIFTIIALSAGFIMDTMF